MAERDDALVERTAGEATHSPEAGVLIASRRELLDPASAVRRAIAGDSTLERAARLVVDAEEALLDVLRAPPGPALPLTLALRQWQRRRWRRLIGLVAWGVGVSVLLLAAAGAVMAAWGLLALLRETLLPR